MAFYVNRERLLEGLKRLRDGICVYQRPSEDCDCKYGASLKGEQTGCPEVRECIALVEQMTDGEFSDIVHRESGSILTEELETALFGRAAPFTSEDLERSREQLVHREPKTIEDLAGVDVVCPGVVDPAAHRTSMDDLEDSDFQLPQGSNKEKGSD